MKVVHYTHQLPEASGVTTFVRGLNDALCDIGVDSCVVTDVNQIGQCDILHNHGMWIPSYHRASLRSTKVVWSSHGMLAPWAMAHKRWKKLIPWHLYQKRDLERAAVFHATVEEEAKWIRDLGFKQPIVIAPLGTHLPEGILTQRHEGTEKTLLFVGRVYPVKALDRLIEAFAKANVDGWKLRIVGPDQAGHMAELEKLVVDSGQWLVDRVEFVGPKFGAELDAEYANCDCLALVSHTENFGATVVDAMAHGKPVITSTNTPWKEVADLGCGWWVDNDIETLAATLRSTLNTPTSTLESMGKRGRKLVEEKYTWPAVAKTIFKAYSALVAEK